MPFQLSLDTVIGPQAVDGSCEPINVLALRGVWHGVGHNKATPDGSNRPKVDSFEFLRGGGV